MSKPDYLNNLYSQFVTPDILRWLARRNHYAEKLLKGKPHAYTRWLQGGKPNCVKRTRWLNNENKNKILFFQKVAEKRMRTAI